MLLTAQHISRPCFLFCSVVEEVPFSVQVDLKLTDFELLAILLPQPPENWGCKHEPSCWLSFISVLFISVVILKISNSKNSLLALLQCEDFLCGKRNHM